MNRGFSLVELSIVLVILGLLVGGILGGRSLIRSAELNSVVKKKQEYAVSIAAFEDKYQALPGDSTDATMFWPGTVNGNGNGRIDYIGNLGGEEAQVWEHLRNAGLASFDTDASTPNLPASSLNSGYYRLSFMDQIYTQRGHYITLNRLGNNGVNGAILSPEDAWSIDSKTDDGSADSGAIMSFNEQAIPGCVETDASAASYHVSATTANYILDNEDVTCKIAIQY